MATISKEFDKSFDRLNEVIEQAEAELSKFPGASSAKVSFRDLGQLAYLEVDLSGNNPEIVCSFYREAHKGGIKLQSTSRLRQLPVADRIVAAYRVPYLLLSAHAKTAELTKEINDLSDSILREIATNRIRKDLIGPL